MSEDEHKPTLADVDRESLARVVKESVEADYDYSSPEALQQAAKWERYLQETADSAADTDTDETVRGEDVAQWARDRVRSEQQDRRG